MFVTALSLFFLFVFGVSEFGGVVGVFLGQSG